MYAMNGRKKEKKKNLSSLVNDIQDEINKSKVVVNNANQKLQALDEITNDQTDHQRLYYADDIKKIRTNMVQPAINYFSSKIKSLQLEQFSTQPQIIRTEIQLSKYEKRNNSPIKSAIRIFIIGLAPSLLGIFIASFAILNDQTVTGVIVLGPFAIAKLIGLGLATGSLKQLVDKN